MKALWFVSKARSTIIRSLGDSWTPVLNLGLTFLSGASMHDRSINQVYLLQLSSGVSDKYRDVAAYEDFASGIVRLTPKGFIHTV